MLQILIETPILLYSFVFLITLMFGSFFNVLIHRLPKMMLRQYREECIEFIRESGDSQSVSLDHRENQSPAYNLLTPPSACARCGLKILARDNIPILSYLFLKGKCRGCKSPISIRYPLVEIITASLSVALLWHFGIGYHALLYILFSYLLLVISFIDLDHQIIPDDLVLPGMWLGIWGALWLPHPPITLHDAVLGASFGYLSLWSIYQTFKLCTGKEGMGYGDFKLLAMIGAFLGWKMLPLVVILSSFSGAIWGVYGIVTSKHQDAGARPIAFGPHLALAGFISMLCGNELIMWYLNLLN